MKTRGITESLIIQKSIHQEIISLFISLILFFVASMSWASWGQEQDQQGRHQNHQGGHRPQTHPGPQGHEGGGHQTHPGPRHEGGGHQNQGYRPMSLGGDMRLRHVIDIGADGNDKIAPGTEDYWEQRFRLSTDFRAQEKFLGHVTLLHTHRWGHQVIVDESGVTMGESQGYPHMATPDRFVADNGLTVNQAYGIWMASDELTIHFGRTSLELADGSVLAKNDFEQVPTAMDGLVVTYDLEPVRSIFWYINFADGVSQNNMYDDYDDKEASSVGGSFDIKYLPSWLGSLSFHLMQNQSDTIGSFTERSSLRYGMSTMGSVMNLNYNLSLASHSGTLASSEMDWSGTMVDLKVGYSFSNAANLRVYGVFHTDSGEDGVDDNGSERYDSFYYDIHANGGELDVFQWGNLTYMGMGVMLEPASEIQLGASYFMFSATHGADSFHAMGGGSVGASKAWMKSNSNNNDNLGSEIDLWVGKRFSDTLNLSLTYSQLTPGDYFAMSDGSAYDTYSKLMLEGSLNF